MLERAVELAERGRGTTYPNPVVGAVVVRDGQVVGEGWHERRGGPHAEVVALEAAGEATRGATIYVTLEPCDHHGTTPPCVDAILAAGVTKVVVGAEDPTRDGIARLREAGVEVELAELWEARTQIEAWLTWARLGRPFVTYKAAVTLDGRMSVPGERWVSGEESRRLVHEVRAASDAVAVGMGTVRADNPRLDARDVDVVRQPRRLAFGRGPLPEGSELELLSGPLDDELKRLAGENVQSLLLESGPTLASAFFEAAVDRNASLMPRRPFDRSSNAESA
jgi:diaminohydroxyphosphoribosylaminopyrimidine deaminase/5-amino-6-(5-phosphoribosylamino)uracil reductase